MKWCTIIISGQKAFSENNSVMEYELNSNAAFEYKTVLNKLYYGETYPLNRKKLIK